MEENIGLIEAMLMQKRQEFFGDCMRLFAWMMRFSSFPNEQAKELPFAFVKRREEMDGF